MERRLDPRAVRDFVAGRMPAYYRAVGQRREAGFLADFDAEIAELSRDWALEERREFRQIAESEFRALRLEMSFQGRDAIQAQYGAELPARVGIRLVVAAVLAVALVASFAVALRR
jgi:hypothetical protein